MDDDLLSRRRATPTLDPTRARPEPWFVGSGAGLMILVLSILAILIVARGVTTLWMVEDAWRWWIDRHRTTGTAIAPPQSTRRLPRVVAVAPLPSASYNPADWITADDYPPAALRAGQEGVVSIRWTVLPSGRVGDCRVVASSGFALLDAAACRAIVRSGRYLPTPGAAIRTQTRRVRWVLPR